MIVFGLTGGIACGKSTVTDTFRANAIPMIDADILARAVVEPNTLGWNILRNYFGKEYFTEDNYLDRGLLAKKVFSDPSAMKALNAFMGPLIDEALQLELDAHLEWGDKIVGYDAALIIEMGNAERYRPLIVVNCPPEMQISRLMKRNNLTRSEAQVRIDAQIPVAEKVKFADFVIDTSGTIENSRLQTFKIIDKLKEML